MTRTVTCPLRTPRMANVTSAHMDALLGHSTRIANVEAAVRAPIARRGVTPIPRLCRRRLPGKHA